MALQASYIYNENPYAWKDCIRIETGTIIHMWLDSYLTVFNTGWKGSSLRDSRIHGWVCPIQVLAPAKPPSNRRTIPLVPNTRRKLGGPISACPTSYFRFVWWHISNSYDDTFPVRMMTHFRFVWWHISGSYGDIFSVHMVIHFWSVWWYRSFFFFQCASLKTNKRIYIALYRRGNGALNVILYCLICWVKYSAAPW